MLLLDLNRTPTVDRLDRDLLIREARRRQRRHRLIALAVLLVAGSGYLLARAAGPGARTSGSLLARSLHFPVLGPGGRCPVSSGYLANNAYFGGGVLGHGPVRVLIGDAGDIPHGHAQLGIPAARGWYALQTLWFAMPSYNGPFVVRAARLGRPGPIEVQPSYQGQAPGSGPLVVHAGATSNTYYTNWRPGHARDPVSGRLVPTLTGYGYRTMPGSTWVRSPGCYAWQVDGRGFSEELVVDTSVYRQTAP